MKRRSFLSALAAIPFVEALPVVSRKKKTFFDDEAFSTAKLTEAVGLIPKGARGGRITTWRLSPDGKTYEVTRYEPSKG